MTASTIDITISEGEAGKRLDVALAVLVPNLSRVRLQALIAEGCLTRNGQPVLKANSPVMAGETYRLTIPEPAAATPLAQPIPLAIVYEDDALLVIDKPAGLVVHPAAGHHDGTLVNALLAHCGATLSGIGGVKRPGIVHRLDKDTSGLMVVAKTDAAHQGLSAQFAAAADGTRGLSREYLALVHGLAPAAFTVDANIGRDPRHRQKMAVGAKGKHAITHAARAVAYGTAATLLRCTLETGRTHQIRVHLKHQGYPIVGDPLYGRLRSAGLPPTLRAFPRQALHAARLAFTHPITARKLAFYAPLPADMATLLTQLSG